MKKIIAILTVLVLALGVVFADNSSVRIKSVVEDSKISISEANAAAPNGLFVLSVAGVLDGSNEATSSSLLMSDYDIAEHDIDIEFSVVQTQRVQTVGKITLTATIGSLSLDDDPAKAVSSASSSWTTAKGLARYEDAITVTAATADNVVSIEIRYIDDTKEVPAQPIGSFVAKWARTPSLASNPGVYKANVTLAYTVE